MKITLILRRATLVLMIASLAACAKIRETRDPQTSDLVLNSDNFPEVNRISVPMPPYRPEVPPERAEAASLWASETTSFFQDRRAEDIGDLVTVLININDRAQLQNATSRTRNASQEVTDPDFLGIDASSASGKAVDLQSTSGASGQGSIQRNESIRLRIAALIIQVLPNGNYVIAGRQEVKVNKELRELRIAGIVRQADINVDNTVSYDKIAEARIAYGGRGQFSTVQSARYGQDALEVILPY